MFNKNPLFLFVIAVCLTLLLPALFMDGMFIDGLLYASVSKNLANGNGTFWELVFSKTLYSHFHEQPPLMFFLQSIFFRVMDDSLYAERTYSLLAAILNGWLIFRSWKLLTGKAETGWLPILLWFIMPVTFWAFINNVEECTMSVFALLAFNSILRANNDTSSNNFKWWVIAGCWILAAGLTKGVQGMFLLSAPFWMWVILQKDGFMVFVRRSFLISAVPIAFVVIAWFVPEIHDSFAAYFASRFGKTFSNVTATGDSYFHLLFELLLDTLPVLFLAFVFIVFGRKTPGFSAEARKNRRMVIFILACGFSGILPLMVTLEQRGFYLVTALPLLALAVALIIKPAAERLTQYFRTHSKGATAISLFALLAIATTLVVTVVLAGEPKRDKDKLEALREIHSHTGSTVIQTSPTITSDWAFITYAQRFHSISLTTETKFQSKWLLLEKGSSAPPDYTLVPMSDSLYSLFIAEGSDQTPR